MEKYIFIMTIVILLSYPIGISSKPSDNPSKDDINSGFYNFSKGKYKDSFNLFPRKKKSVDDDYKYAFYAFLCLFVIFFVVMISLTVVFVKNRRLETNNPEQWRTVHNSHIAYE